MKNNCVNLDYYRLKDINDVHINTNLPVEERIIDYIEQVGNPYRFKCGKIIVNLQFNENGDTLDDLFLKKLKG